MSGAVVIADGLVVGVVRSTNLAADGQSLTVTPLTSINDLPDLGQRRAFWAALNVSNPSMLPLLPEGRDQSSGDVLDYEYDVFISYWPQSIIDPWVNHRFITPFRNLLFEELGRPPSILVAEDAQGTNEGIEISRVLLAIISKQYFFNGQCRSAFESMIQRQIDEGLSAQKSRRLVHAIIAHDCKSIPPEYLKQCDPVDFKDWAYDFEIQDWQTYRAFNDAIGNLASTIAEAVTHAPAWHSGFPLRTPATPNPPTARKPTF